MRSFCFLFSCVSLSLGLLGVFSQSGAALPLGYKQTTIPLDASPSGLAYSSTGVLYALETPDLGTNTATVRVFQPDHSESPGLSFTVTGSDPQNLWIGGMTYDHVDNALLITDNTAGGEIYSINLNPGPNYGQQTTIASGLSDIASISVRSTGELFVTTAPPALSGDDGKVLLIDRANIDPPVEILGDLEYGAGMAFDSAGDLFVMDAAFDFFDPTPGRLQKLPILSEGPLTFGIAESVIDGLEAGYGLAIDSEGNYFITGFGGLFEVRGTPLGSTNFASNGFSSAITFFAGANPFEPYNTDGGWLAFSGNFDENFITLITPGFDEFQNSGVPEPGSGLLLLAGCLLLKKRRWRNR